MSLNIGRKGFIGIGLQSAAQVPAAIADYAPFTDNSLHGVQEQLKVEHATGNRETVLNSVPGKSFSTGNINGLIDNRFFGYFAVAALGSVSTSNPAGSVYRHAITPNNSNTPQYLTITNDRVIDRQIYADVAVDELEISVGTELAMYNASLNGNFPQTTTSGTNTTASGNVMSFRNAQFAFGSTVAAAQAAANLKPHDFKLNIKNNTETVFAHGQGTPRSINNKGLQVTATFSLYFEDTTNRDAYYSQTRRAASLQFIGNSIGSGLNEYVKCNFYQTTIETFELETGLDDYYAEQVSLSGEYDTANSESFAMEIQNTKATYI